MHGLKEREGERDGWTELYLCFIAVSLPKFVYFFQERYCVLLLQSNSVHILFAFPSFWKLNSLCEHHILSLFWHNKIRVEAVWTILDSVLLTEFSNCWNQINRSRSFKNKQHYLLFWEFYGTQIIIHFPKVKIERRNVTGGTKWRS